ncbi:MAG: hypothetical protein JRF50_10755 [Deltaproteobacteria bacterium]|nr:hypothetical protein [Deltaproteobacteria bacterium]
MSIREKDFCVKRQSLALQGYCTAQLFALLKDLSSVSGHRARRAHFRRSPWVVRPISDRGRHKGEPSHEKMGEVLSVFE